MRSISYQHGEHDCGCVTEAHHAEVNKQGCGDVGNVGEKVRDDEIVDGAHSRT
jgi:hypothetical protein